MTRQEIEKLLGEGASKEQVDALLNAMHAEIKSHNICFYVPSPLFSLFCHMCFNLAHTPKTIQFNSCKQRLVWYNERVCAQGTAPYAACFKITQ